MKVKELIELLQKCNLESEVLCNYFKSDQKYDELEPEWFAPSVVMEMSNEEVWIRE
jgi:hypothetical protein